MVNKMHIYYKKRQGLSRNDSSKQGQRDSHESRLPLKLFL